MSSFAISPETFPAPMFGDSARVRIAGRFQKKQGNPAQRPQHDAERIGMSSHETGRNFLPRIRETSPHDFAGTIAGALNDHYGHGNSAARSLAADSGASVDTAENWLCGHNAPSGLYLVRLMACCEPVLDAVLSLAGRARTLDAVRRADAVADLQRAAAALMAEG